MSDLSGQTAVSSRFQNKVVIVSGAGTGIGRAAAIGYAREGANVVLAGRRAAEIESVAHEIFEGGGQAIAAPTDVSQEEDVRRLIATAFDQYGRLDAAFNNAGILGNFAPIIEQTSADFDAVIAVNLKGIWLSMKYEIEAFLKQGFGGSIVNTSSWLTKGALRGSSSYSASKGALDAMIPALVLEYASKGIRINNINPGIIETPMAHGSVNGDMTAFTPFVAHTPAERLGQPDDVADLAIWLSSDEARFVTGQTILVDGGYTIAGVR